MVDEGVDLGTGYVQLQETLRKSRGELERVRGHIEKARDWLNEKGLPLDNCIRGARENILRALEMHNG